MKDEDLTAFAVITAYFYHNISRRNATFFGLATLPAYTYLVDLLPYLGRYLYTGRMKRLLAP